MHHLLKPLSEVDGGISHNSHTTSPVYWIIESSTITIIIGHRLMEKSNKHFSKAVSPIRQFISKIFIKASN